MGFTQSSLARELNTGQSTVSRWLTGAKPQPRTAKELAAALCVRMSWLMDGQEPMELNEENTALTRSHRKGGERMSKLREDDVPYNVMETLRGSALHQDEVNAIREAVMLREEIDRRLDTVATTSTPPHSPPMQALQRRIEEFRALCDQLPPRAVQALREHLHTNKSKP